MRSTKRLPRSLSVLGHVGADLGQLNHLVDPRVGVSSAERTEGPVAAGRDDRHHPVRREPLSLVRLVARLSASSPPSGLLRLPRRTRRIGRRRLRRVLRVLPETGQQLGDLRLQGGDFRLQFGDARVAWIQLRHRNSAEGTASGPNRARVRGPLRRGPEPGRRPGGRPRSSLPTRTSSPRELARERLAEAGLSNDGENSAMSMAPLTGEELLTATRRRAHPPRAPLAGAPERRQQLELVRARLPFDVRRRRSPAGKRTPRSPTWTYAIRSLVRIAGGGRFGVMRATPFQRATAGVQRSPRGPRPSCLRGARVLIRTRSPRARRGRLR